LFVCLFINLIILTIKYERGAFGVVKLIREKSTGQLFAMKVIQKSDMIKRRQEG